MLDAIRLGRAEVMLCGGSEAGITRVGIAGFGAMHALSRRNDDPEHASRPFDAGRDGFVMGEAGAVLVLEELEHATTSVDARIYAELLGYGTSSDAQHVTEPDPSGGSPARAMRMAFADAGITPGEIDYVNAHGTSTPLGDASETRVIKLALGENARTHPGLVDQGRNGPLPRRLGGGRGDLLHARDREGRAPADDQLRDAPTPTAISTTSRTRRGRPMSGSPSPTRSASAGTTPASCSAASSPEQPRRARVVLLPSARRRAGA